MLHSGFESIKRGWWLGLTGINWLAGSDWARQSPHPNPVNITQVNPLIRAAECAHRAHKSRRINSRIFKQTSAVTLFNRGPPFKRDRSPGRRKSPENARCRESIIPRLGILVPVDHCILSLHQLSIQCLLPLHPGAIAFLHKIIMFYYTQEVLIDGKTLSLRFPSKFSWFHPERAGFHQKKSSHCGFGWNSRDFIPKEQVFTQERPFIAASVEILVISSRKSRFYSRKAFHCGFDQNSRDFIPKEQVFNQTSLFIAVSIKILVISSRKSRFLLKKMEQHWNHTKKIMKCAVTILVLACYRSVVCASNAELNLLNWMLK